LRSLWPSYYTETQVLIFVLDGSDVSRLDEARDVFTEVSAALGPIPTLILVNKHDKDNCISLGHAQEELRTSTKAMFVSAVIQ
jgi:GTPase SAR1 family protein